MFSALRRRHTTVASGDVVTERGTYETVNQINGYSRRNGIVVDGWNHEPLSATFTLHRLDFSNPGGVESGSRTLRYSSVERIG